MGTATTFYHVPRWTIETYNTGSSAWESAASWPAGSRDPFTRKYLSNAHVVDLADGGVGIFAPENKSKQEPLSLTFTRRTTTTTFIDNLKSYIDDNTGIRIEMHEGTKIEGYIIDLDVGWDLTGATQNKTIVMEFQPFDIEGDGSIE